MRGSGDRNADIGENEPRLQTLLCQESTMGKLGGTGLSVVAWCLAVGGAVLLLVATLEPASTIPHFLLAGSALSMLGAATYGVSWFLNH
jgi:hypothetical protein